jgi:hypothetical protein
MKRSMWIPTGLVMVGIVMVGCGDPQTGDDRGYTKAPLEEPGLVIEGEAASPMEALGEPDLLNERPRTDPGS